MKVKEQRYILAKGRCEICGGVPSTIHHHFGGRGRRLQKESVETVILVCAECHSFIHGQGWALKRKLQVECCQRLVKKYGENKAREMCGKIYTED